MDANFEISRPHGPVTGDYVRFTARKGDKTWPMRISRTLLTTLGAQEGLTEEASFEANFVQIREMSREKVRTVPPEQEVTLSTYDV